MIWLISFVFFSQGQIQAQMKIDYWNIYFTLITRHTILWRLLLQTEIKQYMSELASISWN